ncbi:O-antigen ligase family protein [bacterium]|nr:O-antigen ligase family protein [bacterium]MDC0309002.1 O-antigen ligase family protein [bacterium]
MSESRKRKSREPKLHRWSDRCTEALIYFMVLFSPWAFGTTQHWSIWTMNITAYGLGVLLVSKWIIRFSTGFRPWPSEVPKNEISPRQHRLRLIHKTCNLLTAICMLLLLGYILTSAINARASFNLQTHEYTYFEGVNKSLPHSYDAKGTWFLFWQYLGLIILFWSTRDWLVGAHPGRSSISLNPRLKRLLFLICLNGGALALECILQRIYYGDYRGEMLFLIEPSINSSNIAQFGPFAYRSNATSYLNMIWPLGLGLFIQLGRENLDYGKRRIGNGPELLLTPSIILAASGPMISSARGGALVMIGLLILVAGSLIFINVRSKFIRLSVSTALLIGLATAYYLGWEKFEPRLKNIFSDKMSNRTQTFETTYKMIDEYGLFGSGPGSFEAVAQFELGEIFTKWQSWVHNDYLEFYLSFGKPGVTILIALTVILGVHFLSTFFKCSTRTLKWFSFLTIAGVAIHAILDFPLQVYSILTLVTLIIAGILTYNRPPITPSTN